MNEAESHSYTVPVILGLLWVIRELVAMLRKPKHGNGAGEQPVSNWKLWIQEIMKEELEPLREDMKRIEALLRK